MPHHHKGKPREHDFLPRRGGGMIMTQLDAQLREIADMSRSDLQRRWAMLTGRPVPRLGIGMLRLALGYEMQTKALGHLSRPDCEQLETSDQVRPRAMPLTPGMRLVREWHGAVHVVTIAEDGTSCGTTGTGRASARSPASSPARVGRVQPSSASSIESPHNEESSLRDLYAQVERGRSRTGL